MNGIVDTTIDVDENSDARALPIDETPHVAHNHEEQTDEDVPRPQIRDRGERFAQLMEYCNSPEGMTRENTITIYSNLTLLISDV